MRLGDFNQTRRGWTLIELLLVIAILAVLAALIDFPAPVNAKRAAQRINCLNNLKQVGLAYRIWEADHGGFPKELSVTNGGTMELVTGSDSIWRSCQVMSNELSTPKILFCPADYQHPEPATNFSADLKGKISYFVGLDASSNRPQALLSGDDNLVVAGLPVQSGVLTLVSNSPVSWTAPRHHASGNIGLADGSVQWLKDPELVVRLGQTGLATNRLAIP